MEILTKKSNIVLDATLLTSLMSCGRLTDLRYNHRFQSSGGKSNSLEVGSIVHEVMETYYKMRIQGFTHQQAVGFGLTNGELYVRSCPSCTNYEGDGKPECGHSPNKYPGVLNTPLETTSSPSRIGWKNALETCEAYFDFYRADQWVPLEVEKVLSKILYEDDELRILWKGKLDLIADTSHGIFPVDHKTMKQRRETLSLNNQFMGQCLLMTTRAMWVNKIGFQTSLKPAERFSRHYMHYSLDRLNEWQNEILPYWGYKLLEYQESGYFPPNFTHCENKFGTCSFREVCEANRNMREEELRMKFIVGPEWNPVNEND